MVEVALSRMVGEGSNVMVVERKSCLLELLLLMGGVFDRARLREKAAV